MSAWIIRLALSTLSVAANTPSVAVNTRQSQLGSWHCNCLFPCILAWRPHAGTRPLTAPDLSSNPDQNVQRILCTPVRLYPLVWCVAREENVVPRFGNSDALHLSNRRSRPGPGPSPLIHPIALPALCRSRSAGLERHHCTIHVFAFWGMAIFNLVRMLNSPFMPTCHLSFVPLGAIVCFRTFFFSSSQFSTVVIYSGRLDYSLVSIMCIRVAYID